jgi:AcrR family transcriptional regulator
MDASPPTHGTKRPHRGRTTRGRPKSPLLSSQQILDNALAVIDEDGAHKFSIHQVARRLGVQPASIYYYFADRDELLASVCLRVLQDVHVPKRRPAEWGARLLQDAVAYFRALSEHPNLAATLLNERRTRAGAEDRMEDALAQLKDAGIAPADGIALIDCIEGIALSWIAFQRVSSVDIDAESYPTLGAASKKQKYDESSYKRSIAALIDGWQSTYAAGTVKRAPRASA